MDNKQLDQMYMYALPPFDWSKDTYLLTSFFSSFDGRNAGGRCVYIYYYLYYYLSPWILILPCETKNENSK